MSTLVERADSFLDEFIRGLELHEPSQHEGLWLLPLCGRPSVECPPVLTLTEALRDGSVSIREVTEQGQVNELTLESRARRPVLLLDGEELVGACQNRILNTSVLVGAGTQARLPVSCVEQGRWAYQGRAQLASEGRLSPVGLRSRKLRQVTRSLRDDRGFGANQQEVWKEVERLNTRLGARSATQAMSAGLNRQTVFLTQEARPAQLGVLVVLGDQVLGLDALGTPALYESLQRALLNSYALEAQGRGVAPLSGRRALGLAREFLKNLARRCTSVHRSPGHGLEARFSSRNSSGSALLYGGAVVHLTAFPEQK